MTDGKNNIGIGEYKEAVKSRGTSSDNDFEKIVRLLTSIGDTHRLSKISQAKADKLTKILIFDKINYERFTKDPEFEKLVKEGKLRDSTNIPDIVENILNLAVSVTNEDNGNLLNVISNMFQSKKQNETGMEQLLSNLKG